MFEGVHIIQLGETFSNALTAHSTYTLTPLSAFICVLMTHLYVMPRNSPMVALYPARTSSNVGRSRLLNWAC